MNVNILRTQIQLKEMVSHLKPRRRQLFKEKDSSILKSCIPTLTQAERIQQNMSILHKRVKSKKKQKLCDLFALNKQKSVYQQLFSKNKENRQTKNKSKRCISEHVKRPRTCEQHHISRDSFSMAIKKRPLSSYSTKKHRTILTIQSQF